MSRVPDPPNATHRALATLIAVVVAAGLAMYLAGTRSEFEPARRNGPLLLVQAGDGSAGLWLAVHQVEVRTRRIGGGRHSTTRWITERFRHLRLQAHDPATTRPRWQRTLEVRPLDRGVQPGELRLLGQQGDAVWAWMNDGPLLLAAADGARRADLAAIEAANPGLAGLFPRELRHWTWLDALLVRLADGRLVRIDAATLAATGYGIADPDAFAQAGQRTWMWHGGYDTAAFGVRHGWFDGEWIGLFSEAEAADAANDPWGDHLFSSAEVADEGAAARRRFWRGLPGRTREFSEGSHPRLAALEPLPDGRSWLQGRLLKAPATAGSPAWVRRGNTWRAAPGEPVRMSAPDGALVLHRTRLDARGRLALARLDRAFAPLWDVPLPLAELSNRWPTPDGLLLYGHWDDAPPTRRDRREALVAVDLANGDWRGWEVGSERALGGGADLD